MGIRKKLQICHSFVGRHRISLNLLVGLVVISLWTLLRFFDRQTIYDMVTQQLIARSWLHGIFTPIQMGPTNYLLKVVSIYLPLQLLPGSARIHIVVSTLLINAVTFLLLFVVIRRLLKELAPTLSPNLGRSMIWLSLVAGSAFWIQFSNSRNLEVVGGTFLIERCLTYIRNPTKHLGAFILIFSSVLFFADPLQMYMTAVPTLLYLYFVARRLRPSYLLISLGLLLASGVVISKIIFHEVASLLQITFISGSKLLVAWNPKLILKAAALAIRELPGLIAGQTELGRLYQVLLIGIMLLVVYLFIRSIRHKLVPRNVALFVLIFVLAEFGIYILSGQSLQPGTSRYLIMLLPICMICIALLQDVPLRQLMGAGILNIVFILVTAFCLVGLSDKLHPSHDADSHLSTIRQYIARKDYKNVFGSMDTALPLDYYLNSSQVKVTALACGPNGLLFSRAKPISLLMVSGDEDILIFDGNQISNVPYVCSSKQVNHQIGDPLRTEYSTDGSTVFIYPRGLLTRILPR